MGKHNLISSFDRREDREREPHAPETLRRLRVLSSVHDTLEPSLLARANDTVARYIDEVAAHAPRMYRNRDDGGHDDGWQLFDASILEDPSAQIDWRPQAKLLGLNASAGVGKSYGFLLSLAKQCHEHKHMTAAVLSPAHYLSEQSFNKFVSQAAALGIDAEEFARVFIAVDEGCSRTCHRLGSRRPEKQRKFMSKCGVRAKNFCHKVVDKETGMVINPGCPFVEDCDYWKQFEGAETIRVWFHTYAAAQKESLRLAGIDIKFDRRCLDESLLSLYVEQEVIRLDHLPITSEASMLNSIDNRSTETKEDLSEESVLVFAALLKFMNTARVGEKGEKGAICDGDASFIPAPDLFRLHDTFTQLYRHTLRADPHEYGYDYKADVPKDRRSAYKVTLDTLARQREEAKAAMLGCELLLGFHVDGQMRGYDVDRHNNEITIYRRAGFSKMSEAEYAAEWATYEQSIRKWVSNKVTISRVRRRETPLSEMNEMQRMLIDDVIWEEPDEKTGKMKPRWTNPKPRRPRHMYVGATLEYYDATLTPEVFNETLRREPDVAASRDLSFQYILLPDRCDLVETIQVTGNKFSRGSLGIGDDTKKKTKDDETGRYLDPTEEELAEHKPVVLLKKIAAIIEYHKLRGDDPVVIAPKQIVPDNVASNAYVETLPELKKGEASAYMTHGAVAGRNDFEDTGALLIISQGFNESPRYHENMAIALTGRPVERIGLNYPNCDIEDYAKRGSGDNIVHSSRPTHPDPLVEAIRWQHMEGAQIQAIARARGVRRGRSVDGEQAPSCSRPLRVYQMQRLILDNPQTKWKKINQMLPSHQEYLEALGLQIPDLSQHGAMRLSNLLVPEVMHRSHSKQFTDRITVSQPEGWEEAIAVLPEAKGHRRSRVRVWIDPRHAERIIERGIALERGVSGVRTVLEELMETGAKNALLADVGARLQELQGGVTPSGQTVRKLIEELGQPRWFAIKKIKKGLAVVFLANVAH